MVGSAVRMNSYYGRTGAHSDLRRNRRRVRDHRGGICSLKRAFLLLLVLLLGFNYSYIAALLLGSLTFTQSTLDTRFVQKTNLEGQPLSELGKADVNISTKVNMTSTNEFLRPKMVIKSDLFRIGLKPNEQKKQKKQLTGPNLNATILDSRLDSKSTKRMEPDVHITTSPPEAKQSASVPKLNATNIDTGLLEPASERSRKNEPDAQIAPTPSPQTHAAEPKLNTDALETELESPVEKNEVLAQIVATILPTKDPVTEPKSTNGNSISEMEHSNNTSNEPNLHSVPTTYPSQKSELGVQFFNKKHNLNFVPSHQNCKSRDLTEYTYSKATIRHDKITNQMDEARCMHFQCTKDISKCDNTLATDYTYSGPDDEPPCCVHILRDMARIFDEEMCRLGLDYAAAYGTLLGFARSDRIIPWTGDNDYIIPSREVANAMVALWNTSATGMAHLWQDINRMCLTSDFAGGKLSRWRTIQEEAPKDTTNFAKKADRNTLWSRGFPYIDFYVGHRVQSFTTQPALLSMNLNLVRGGAEPLEKKKEEIFEAFPGCQHFFGDIFPTQQVFVYENTFSQNVPANTGQLLRTYYGDDWRIPNADKNPHGIIPCPYSPLH